jgi:hypothetical protein
MTETFPTKAALQRLGDQMNADKARYVDLGVVDCRFGVRVEDTGAEYTITFDTYGCTGVEDGVEQAQFVVEAESDIWQAMYDDIILNGRASRDQTINYLTLPGIAMRVTSPQEDMLEEDLFSRYNQTFQSYFDGAAAVAPVAAVR